MAYNFGQGLLAREPDWGQHDSVQKGGTTYKWQFQLSHGLKTYKDHDPLPAEAFHKDGTANCNQSIPSSVEKQVLSILGKTTSFIPIVGNFLGTGSEILVEFLEQQEQKPEKVDEELKIGSIITGAFQQDLLRQAQATSTSIKKLIERNDDAFDIYKLRDLSAKDELEDFLKDLETHCNGQTEDSLTGLIEKIETRWNWADIDAIELLLELYGRFFECYRIRCIVLAQLAGAAKKEKHFADFIKYSNRYKNTVRMMSSHMKQSANSLKERINQVKRERLEKVSGFNSGDRADADGRKANRIYYSGFMDKETERYYFYDVRRRTISEMFPDFVSTAESRVRPFYDRFLRGLNALLESRFRPLGEIVTRMESSSKEAIEKLNELDK